MSAATSITVRVPLKIRRRPGQKTVVMPVEEEAGDGTMPTRADPALVKALARAFRYQRLLDEGHDVLCVDNLFTGTKDNILPLFEKAGGRYFNSAVVLDGDGTRGVYRKLNVTDIPLWEEKF